MQQTTNYKLNLIETSDPFSPKPLNENAEKTDAKFAALDAADAALDSRVQVLELRKFAAGWYKGNDAKGGMHIDLGFTPKVVYVSKDTFNLWHALATPGHPSTEGKDKIYLQIEDGGIRVDYYLNYDAYSYSYLALA